VEVTEQQFKSYLSKHRSSLVVVPTDSISSPFHIFEAVPSDTPIAFVPDPLDDSSSEPLQFPLFDTEDGVTDRLPPVATSTFDRVLRPRPVRPSYRSLLASSLGTAYLYKDDPPPPEPPDSYSSSTIYSSGEPPSSDTVQPTVKPSFNNVVIDELEAHLIMHSFIGTAKLNVGKALKSSYKLLWVDAMLKEINLLLTGGTLRPVSKAELLPNGKIIHSTMQLKEKFHADGSLDKLKARLCACGNELLGTIMETYSPTIGILAHAAILQLAIIDRMHMCTIDTVGAYLYQDYPCGPDDVPLYLSLPDNVAVACNLPVGQLYRIQKYLYGLPDSGRAYYKAYSDSLEADGYMRTVSDPCLFVKVTDSARTYAWIHVDDTFVCSTNAASLCEFQDTVRKSFTITVNSEVTEYLGIKLHRLPNGDMQLTQPKLLASLFDEYSTALHATSRVPSTPYLTATSASDTDPYNAHDYMHLLGALLFLCKSRPDIATAVSFGSTHAVRPLTIHFAELLQILRYLFHTRTHGLTLHAGVPNRPLILTCYVDASYLTHADSKSHTGYTLSFGSVGTFYSKSSKQSLVTTSSTHAELRALYSLSLDVLFVITLCEEIGRPLQLPAIIMIDNQPAIDVTTDLSSKVKRCKHFLMLINFIREQVSSGLLQLRKVNTNDNLADILTKITFGKNFIAKSAELLGDFSSPPLDSL
jgi:hypothetical protein